MINIGSLKSHPLFQGASMVGPGRFQCGECFKSFRNNAHLKRHAVVHTREKPYTCELCQDRFTRPESLKRHLKNVHHLFNEWT